MPRHTSHREPSHNKPARRLPLHSLLSHRAQRARRHVPHIDQFLHGKYHASGLRRMSVIHRLHATPQSESGQRALYACAERDGGTSEGDAEVRVWLGGGW
jgi:hypothetical protein